MPVDLSDAGREKLRELCAKWEDKYGGISDDELMVAMTALPAVLDALEEVRKVLHSHGSHQGRCTGHPCNCGLSTALGEETPK